MRSKFVGLLAGALLAIAAVGASSASAAAEFGDSCVADNVTEFALFEIASSSNPLPIAAPTAGVITKWKVNLIPVPVSLPQILKVARSTGAPNSIQIVGESGAQTVTGGSNSFDTRIPVNAGDRLGLFGPGPEGTLYCTSSNPADVVGGFIGNVPVGSTAPFAEFVGEARVPVSAVLEPDADRDGYGDETQDKCPQSASTQAPCPVAVLSTSTGTVGKGLVKVLVTSNIQAAVTVGGTVKLGKGKTATLSGGTQVVLPGTIATFTLLFTQKLKAKLKTLSRKQRLTLNLTATTPNVVGAPSVSALSVKLKGQKKPKPKKGKGKAKGQA